MPQDDPLEKDLSSDDELSDTVHNSSRVHEGEQTIERPESFGHAATLESISESCTELCCSAGGEISQPTDPSIFKKTEKCLDQVKMLVTDLFLQSWY